VYDATSTVRSGAGGGEERAIDKGGNVQVTSSVSVRVVFQTK